MDNFTDLSPTKQQLAARAPKYIRVLVGDRVRRAPGPYLYSLVGRSGNGVSIDQSASATWEKLQKWATRIGSEAQITDDQYANWYAGKYGRVHLHKGARFRNIDGGRRLTDCRLMVEISDPAAQIIDAILSLPKEKNQ